MAQATAGVLLLVSACAQGLEPIADAALADTTGQAGLEITTTFPSTGLTGIFHYEDTDGGAGNSSADFVTGNPDAANLLAGFKLTGKMLTTLDVGANASSQANVLIETTTDSTGLGLTINSLSTCAASQDTSSGCNSGFGSDILALPAGGLTVTLANMDLKLLLGASNSQHFISMDLPASFNITVGTGNTANDAPQFSLLDPNNVVSSTSAGGIGVSELQITQTAASTTTVDACASAATITCSAALTGGLSGLLIQSNAQLNVTAYNVTLGDVGSATPSAAIGNVAVYGLSMSGVSIMVSGH
jgi:hypothetical protein